MLQIDLSSDLKKEPKGFKGQLLLYITWTVNTKITSLIPMWANMPGYK